MTTPEQIAAGLTENQIWSVRTGLWPTGNRRLSTIESLCKLGLWRANGTFTPLCQSVRAILKEQADAK
jgi:hypothetical protein